MAREQVAALGAVETRGAVRMPAAPPSVEADRPAAEPRRPTDALADRADEARVAGSAVVLQRRFGATPPAAGVRAESASGVVAARDESGSLVVPGLEVVSVAWIEEGGAAGAVRVLQLLPTGDTLELVHLPSGTDPSALGTVPGDPRTSLVVPRPEGWLVIRALVAGETLAELVRQLDEGVVR